ncbi:rhodanese-like domain-containing protein [Kribbella sp. NPDC003505]|uniref:rhodanese-like domain-containing protein n=1 Tax=Kribbella sp. NPDC003505 TaxID=3154448 RepID=UPI0033B68FF6
MREIDPDRLATALRSTATVVDVREPREYADGHVPGAVNIPMGRLPGRIDEIDRSAPVYVVCATGNRSSAMTQLLIGAGFDAYNVAGGTSAWIRSGHPIHK